MTNWKNNSFSELSFQIFWSRPLLVQNNMENILQSLSSFKGHSEPDQAEKIAAKISATLISGTCALFYNFWRRSEQLPAL